MLLWVFVALAAAPPLSKGEVKKLKRHCARGEMVACAELADANYHGRGEHVPRRTRLAELYAKQACAAGIQQACMIELRVQEDELDDPPSRNAVRRTHEGFVALCGGGMEEACGRAEGLREAWPALLRDDPVAPTKGAAHGEGIAVTEGSGSLEPHVISNEIETHLGAIEDCYQERLDEHPDLAGQLVIQFTIGEDGTVQEAAVKSSELGEDGVGQCVVGRFLRMRFPEPGGTVVVTYPFLFQPG